MNTVKYQTNSFMQTGTYLNAMNGQTMEKETLKTKMENGENLNGQKQHQKFQLTELPERITQE